MLTGDLLTDAASRFSDKTAIICGARRLAYADLDAAANRFANALIADGLRKGDCVAIMARNRPDYAVAHFGGARAGTVLVNLLTAYAPTELGRILEKTRPRLLVVEDAFQSQLAPVLTEDTPVERIVVIGAPGLANAVDIDSFLSGRADDPPSVDIADTDPVAMTFTGGTTGLPKGAVVSHRARLISTRISVDAHGLRGDDVIAVVSPLFHAIALLVWYQSAVMLGATCVFQTRWDAGDFIDLVARERVTAVLMVPQQIRAVLDHPGVDAARLRSLRTIVSGGAQLPPALADRVRAELPHVALLDDFGQSETGPLTVLGGGDMIAKPGTIGRAIDAIELAIVAPDGTPVAPGGVGELVTRGDHLMTGYFDDARETARYFKNGDGWGWTGDLARLDDDGFITLVGRAKEMIVSGGENIYPREVELVLEGHPDVAACAVIGIADEKWGEALAAFIVRRDGASITADQVREHCAAHLARFKRPSLVRFVDALPMTAAGKVRKNELKTAYPAGTARGEDST